MGYRNICTLLFNRPCRRRKSATNGLWRTVRCAPRADKEAVDYANSRSDFGANNLITRLTRLEALSHRPVRDLYLYIVHTYIHIFMLHDGPHYNSVRKVG